MLYKNVAPKHNVEKKYCQQISEYLSKHLGNDIVLYVREWNQVIAYPNNAPFITIVTSAEGHNYVPQDSKKTNCLGVFMHYFPKSSNNYLHDQNNFLELKNVYPLPLGITDLFTGNNGIPINHRDINVSFVGQLDPYRRLDFYNNIAKFAEKIENSVFHFFEGWNNGIGNKYSEIMANTKIALVPSGLMSLDTYRYYEAAKCGCVIVCDKQNNYEFMKGAPHVVIENWSRLEGVIQSLISGPSHLNKTSNNIYNFWKRRLSPEGAARFILEKIK